MILSAMKRHSERKAETFRRNFTELVLFTIAALALIALLILGHRVKGEKQGTIGSKGAAPVAKSAANDPVLIEVNGEKIHASEFQAAISSFPANMRATLATANGKREVAEQLVKMKLLEQEARRMNLEENPEVSGPLSVMHSQILAAAALEKLVKGSGAVDLRKYYDENREKFERVRFRQILIAVEGGDVPPRSGRPLSDDAAKKRAESIVGDLRRGGRFEQAAQASDDAGGANRGGDMGTVRRGMLPPDIETVVFGLKPNEISDPIRTRYGYHIFQVTDRGYQPFEELQQALKHQEPSLKAERLVDSLMKQAEIKLDPKFFGTARLQ